jgi:hypothetical protein
VVQHRKFPEDASCAPVEAFYLASWTRYCPKATTFPDYLIIVCPEDRNMTISDGFSLGIGIMLAFATLIAVIAVIGLLIDVCQRTNDLFPVGK